MLVVKNEDNYNIITEKHFCTTLNFFDLYIHTTKTEIVDLTKKLLISMCQSNKLIPIALFYSGILLLWVSKTIMEIN